MSKNHDDIDQDTTAAEAADSLKAWLASPAQGDTHAEDSEAASEPENTPNEDAPGDDAEEDAQEGTQEPQEEPGDHQREDGHTRRSRGRQRAGETPSVPL